MQPYIAVLNHDQVTPMTEQTARPDQPQKRRITHEDVRASFNNQVRNMLWVRLIGRPLANRLTPFFFNRGWTANQMTSLRLFVALLALIALASGIGWCMPVAAVLFYLFFIGDCLDGNLARLSDGATYWGKFYDGLADRFFYVLSPLAAGIGTWAASGDGIAIAAGALTTVSVLYNELVQTRFGFYRQWMESQRGAAAETDSRSVAAITAFAGRMHTHASFLAPLVLLLPGGLGLYLWCLVLFQGIPSAVSLLAQLWNAYRILLRPRKSMHAAGVDPRTAATPGLMD